MFLIFPNVSNCAKKKEIKKQKTNNKRKAEESEKKNMRENENKAKKVSKRFVKVTMKRKDTIFQT